MATYERPTANLCREFDEDRDYLIFDDGRVFSIRWNRFLKLTPNNYGYLTAKIGRKQRLVHRVIAKMFVPNPENFDHVHHKNENPLDNRAENLVWISNSEHQKLHRNRSKKVCCIETGEIFSSARDAARHIGIFENSVTSAINRNHKAGGYRWKYI